MFFIVLFTSPAILYYSGAIDALLLRHILPGLLAGLALLPLWETRGAAFWVLLIEYLIVSLVAVVVVSFWQKDMSALWGWVYAGIPASLLLAFVRQPNRNQ